jgi:hypothetical protein
MTNKYQRTEIEERELQKLSQRRIQPANITDIQNIKDCEKSYMRVIVIDYEQGNKDKELVFEININ